MTNPIPVEFRRTFKVELSQAEREARDKQEAEFRSWLLENPSDYNLTQRNLRNELHLSGYEVRFERAKEQTYFHVAGKRYLFDGHKARRPTKCGIWAFDYAGTGGGIDDAKVDLGLLDISKL